MQIELTYIYVSVNVIGYTRHMTLFCTNIIQNVTLRKHIE